MAKQQSIDVQVRFKNLAKSGVAESFFNRNYTEIKYTVVGYEFLKSRYNAKGKISEDYLFRWFFEAFYAMIPRRYVSIDFIKLFYEEMDKIRDEKNRGDWDAAEIAKELYDKQLNNDKNDTDDKNNTKISFQFSFVTKMLNLADDTQYPIYDSKVALIFNCHYPADSGVNQKVVKYKQQYDQIKEDYKNLLKNEAVQQIIDLFKETFDCKQMSDLRALDIIVWEMGKELDRIMRVFKDKNKNETEKDQKLKDMGFSDAEIDKLKTEYK